MKGDFSRNTFDASKHFSRVLLQQGRVQLDADWNEQAAILLHYLHTLATDLIGEHGGPAGYQGFGITNGTGYDFPIGNGRYYVQGILCENENPALTYASQSDYPLTDSTRLQAGTYLVYLDVWERLITAVEDDGIREVALGGPDTAARSKVVWQVKVWLVIPGTTCEEISRKWQNYIERWQPNNRGELKADALKTATDNTDPCLIAPDAHYRGAENQLYRVEIHRGGQASDNPPPTFKWSRENGSVVFPIRALSGNVVTVEHLGRDGRFTLQPGDWVEIVDNDIVNLGQAHPLHKVKSIDRVELKVTLETLETDPMPDYDPGSTKHPLLRRWDHKMVTKMSGGATPIAEGSGDVNWLPLEDGIQIQFQPAASEETAHQYGTGDYWLIPARTATGDIEWPEDTDGPIAQGPKGKHVYAPLCLITVAADGSVTIGEGADCRHLFWPVHLLELAEGTGA